MNDWNSFIIQVFKNMKNNVGIYISSKDFANTDFSRMSVKQISAFFDGLKQLIDNDKERGK